MGIEPGSSAGSRAVSALVYAVLLVLGALQGVIGSFQYGQPPTPAFAILLDVIIFATCLLGGWGTMSLSGALAPAAGWIIASFILSTGTHEGSVIITNSAAGKWYLYGGTLAAAVGAASGFIVRLRAQSRPPG